MDYKNLFNLNGKTSIVTGSGTGLGREIAIALAQFGSNVIVADVNRENGKQTAEDLKKYGIGVHFIQTDVSNEEDVRALIDQTIEHFGSIDVLVNNAGIMQKKNFEDMSLMEWQRIMDVNINSVFLMSKYVGVKMIGNGGGSIINTASISSFISNKEPQCAYNTSKAGILMITKCLASEWAQHNIRVNAIAPGYTKTTMTEGLLENDKELEEVLNLIPLKRVAEPSEIAGLVVVLASNASSYTTGSVINADGGYMVW